MLRVSPWSDCDGETQGCCVEFLVFHVLLCADEGVVVDMDPAAERKIDVGDGEQHESDEKSEGEYLEGVKPGICRAEHGSGGDGENCSDEKDGPEDGGETVLALEQAGAAVFCERAEFREGVIFGDDLGWGCQFDGHQRLPHGLIDIVA